MREILFRGRRLDGGEWVVGHYSFDEIDHYIIRYQLEADDFGDVYSVPSCYLVDPDSVGQFTGLTDKDGKRIFEGDIIQKNVNRFCIEYGDGVAHFIAASKTPRTWAPCLNRGTMEIYEVVGNIHDNPELI